ncbi:hypothetical protein GCM10011402_35990 [Paracoccus acridae]|uniref:Uncharacterized protein n=1 Tax=Paracoccus acridae TaxID=1795310 RepID=A0ABQ1VM28_9RHOB|nr:hypothetical protein [Paracoccus acridae]GGF80154.1 hypothetical protein GCM10011402_35990 [Paracoccus acridae]
MTDKAHYTFKIEGFTPETMPFGRLIDYYAQLKQMLGLTEHLHLVNVFKSSHATCLAVDAEARKHVEERLLEIKDGSAPKNALRARDQINFMLQEDGTSAEFFGPDRTNVIPFPGTRADDDVIYSICDQAVFSGELYHIAVSKNDVKLRVATDAFGVVYCVAPRKMGITLREFLDEQIQITGRGTWKRTTDGAWTVNDVTIIDFQPIEKSFRETVDRLRALDIDWPEDVLGEIDRIEERGGQFH